MQRTVVYTYVNGDIYYSDSHIGTAKNHK